MASNPTVTAIISAQDNASPVLAQVAANAERVTRDAARASTKAMHDAQAAAAATHAAAVRTVRSLGTHTLEAIGAFRAAAHEMHFLVEAGKEYSQGQNILTGILKDQARGAGLAAEQVERLAKAQRAAINRDVGEAAGAGRINPFQMQESINDALKANNTPEMATAIAQTSATLQQANAGIGANGGMDLKTTNDGLITMANTFGMTATKADGTKKTVAELRTELTYLADVITKLTHSSTATPLDNVNFMRIVAPAAHLVHMDVADLAAIEATMAERGIKGEEAATAIRTAIGNLVAPKASAVAYNIRNGINLAQFTHRKEGLDYEVNGPNEARYFASLGYQVDPKAAERAIATARMPDGSLDMPKYVLGQRKIISKLGKAGHPIDPRTSDRLLAEYYNQGVQGFDVVGYLKELQSKNPTLGDLRSLFEPKQASRIAAVIQKNADGSSVLQREYDRMYGPGAYDKIQPGQHREPAKAVKGTAEHLADERFEGFEGAMKRFSNSIEALKFALGNAGVFDDMAVGVNKIADVFLAVAKLDPKVLEYGAIAAGLATVGGGVLALSRAVAAFIALPGALKLLANGGAAVAAAEAGGTGAVVAGGTGAGGGMVAGAVMGADGALTAAVAALPGVVTAAVLLGGFALIKAANATPYAPADHKAYQDTLEERDRVKATIDGRKARAFDKSAYDPEVARLEGQVADLDNRLNAYTRKAATANPLGNQWTPDDQATYVDTKERHDNLKTEAGHRAATRLDPNAPDTIGEDLAKQVAALEADLALLSRRYHSAPISGRTMPPPGDYKDVPVPPPALPGTPTLPTFATRPDPNMRSFPTLPPRVEPNLVSMKTSVDGEVHGSADIVQHITVEPSPLLIAKLEAGSPSKVIKVPLSGKLGKSMDGPTGAQPAERHGRGDL